METRWLYRTSEDLGELLEASKGVCVIPMGCVEKHGLHLPLGTDAIQAESIALLASSLETVCIFPTFVVGDLCAAAPSAPHGTITLPMEVEELLLELYCEQIARAGFRKILVYNAHGGNKSWLAAFLRRLQNKKRDFCLGIVSYTAHEPREIAAELLEKGRGIYPELTTEDEDYLIDFLESKKQDGHGGLGETALLMAVAPESVKMDRLGIESGLNTHAADYLKEAGIMIQDNGWGQNFPNAYAGDDPVGCNERIAKVCLEVAARKAAHAFKVYKDDENVLRWLDEYQKGW